MVPDGRVVWTRLERMREAFYREHGRPPEAAILPATDYRALCDFAAPMMVSPISGNYESFMGMLIKQGDPPLRVE